MLLPVLGDVDAGFPTSACWRVRPICTTGMGKVGAGPPRGSVEWDWWLVVCALGFPSLTKDSNVFAMSATCSRRLSRRRIRCVQQFLVIVRRILVCCITRSRRNPRSTCAWLTGPEPRWGYARTSFGVDAAAKVTISKCNLWNSWTLELTSEFSHAHLTIFSTVWDVGWFYQDHASRVNAKLQKIYQYFVG